MSALKLGGLMSVLVS